MKKQRSWLFVPGDSEEKLGNAAGAGADVVVIDLEDSVADHAKMPARNLARQWLSAHRQNILQGQPMGRWVRINALDSLLWREDLAVIMSADPDGIIVPKVSGPQQLRMLAAELYELEQRSGLEPNSTLIMPMVAETPQSALSIPAYASDELPRLAGLTWGAEDLAGALGAARSRDEHGNWTDVFRMVRSQMLLAAHARGGLAIDTPYGDFKDLDGLKKRAADAYADGFSGMIAIHPDQLGIINDAFAAGAGQIAEAQAIIDAFAANPGAGALQYEGRMIEQPHLSQAKRLLEAAA